MNIKQTTELIEVLVSLISAISWPLVAVFMVIFLGKPIKRILGNVSELSLKAGGFEAQAKTQEIEAAASLGAAVAQKNIEPNPENKISTENESFKIAGLVNRVFQPRVINRLANKKILWVDDIPENNFYERRSLETLGIKTVTATSTEDALKKLQQNNYDVIISDMGRPPDNRAGYTLLDSIQKKKINIPFIIYSGSNLPEHRAEARQRGAYGSTNTATELFELVVSSID